MKNENKFRIGLSSDNFKNIILKDKPLSELISWKDKKKLVNESIVEIEQSIEKIFLECTKISNDKKAGFFLSVGGNDWIRKDSWNSPILDRYLQKQLSFYLNITDSNSIKLFDKIIKKNFTIKKKIKYFLKIIFNFFNIFFSSFVISLINTLKKKNFFKITTLSFIGKRIEVFKVKNNLNNRIVKFDTTFQLNIKNLFKFFIRNQSTDYDYASLIDWFYAIKFSTKYFFVWKKFLYNNGIKNNFYYKINNSFTGIFHSVFHYRAISKYIIATKPKFILHGGPNHPSVRRIFFAGSELGVSTISVFGKVMINSNMGYRFNKNKMKCDQMGIADKFFVSTISAKNTLLQNGINVSDIKVADKIIKKTNTFNNKITQDKTILICLTNREKVNDEIYKFIKCYFNDPTIRLLIRAHPLLNLSKQLLFSSSNKFIDVSTLSFDEIFKTHCSRHTKSLVVSNYSSASCKALEYGFMPIWLKNLGESPILFSEIIENVGKSANTLVEFNNLVDKFFQNLNFENDVKNEKKKSDIYIDRIINERHINEYIRNLEN